ncbi:MAG TPA: hypothetical protein VNM66_06235, partial [Thermodesulfobacteriota bacterium]|nr:hypothetical protein [Thermodesulfobacteriota bacterium]
EGPARPADALDVFFRAELAPSGFAWRVPIRREGRPRAKVGVMAPGRPRRALERLVDDLRQRGEVCDAGAAVVTRPLPLGPLGRTYADRVLVIGDAAGLVKPTTGGGIYYSLLSAGWAAEAVRAAFDRGDFSAGTLAAYEESWRSRLGAELRVGLWFRRLAARLTPDDLDALVELAIVDGVVPLIRSTARFNWHRDLILTGFRHPGVLRIVVARLLQTTKRGREGSAGRPAAAHRAGEGRG